MTRYKVVILFPDDEEEEGQKGQHPDMRVFPDEELASVVDMTLREHDTDEDGYIDYAEFVKAQRKSRGDDN